MRRRRLKAFLFTLDAVLGLLLLSAVTIYSLALFSSQPLHASKYAALNELGRDYLKLNYGGLIDKTKFNELTGFNAFSQPSNETKMQARATAFIYPKICSCGKGIDCFPVDNECVEKQEIDAEKFFYEVWVSP